MNATSIGGIAGALVGLGGAAAIHLAGRDETAKDETRARAEWTAWKTKLDAEFPTRTLAGADDEARFKDFLDRNPAPSWLHVEYEDLRRISLDPFETSSPVSNMGGALGIGAIGAGLVVGFGGASVAWSSKFPTAVNGLGAAAQFGGAALALGVIGASFFQPKADSLHQEIESTEWHTPSSWTD